MAQLLVRNIEESVVQALKRAAIKHGRSTEEEHRELLRAALLRGRSAKTDFKTALASIPPGDDDLFDRPADRGRDVSL